MLRWQAGEEERRRRGDVEYRWAEEPECEDVERRRGGVGERRCRGGEGELQR